MGLEPTSPFERQNLNLVRLPVSPHPHEHFSIASTAQLTQRLRESFRPPPLPLRRRNLILPKLYLQMP